MTKRTLRFSLSSYWRVSSGKGSDAVADVLVLRDANGLPTIPGRAVKGLLREAMTLATLSGTVSRDRVVRWFGSELPGHGGDQPVSGDHREKQLEAGRFESTEAGLWFGSASLPAAWGSWACQNRGSKEVKALFGFQSSTSIGDDGMAVDHTLRVSEVAIPMDLRAEVCGPSDDLSWVEDLRSCLPLLRCLGSRRNRGLGRVDVSLEEAK